MAIKSTIYKAQLQIADIDHGYYADHALTLARQSQRMVGVIAMVDVGDLQLRLVNGRFDSHGR